MLGLKWCLSVRYIYTHTHTYFRYTRKKNTCGHQERISNKQYRHAHTPLNKMSLDSTGVYSHVMSAKTSCQQSMSYKDLYTVSGKFLEDPFHMQALWSRD